MIHKSNELFYENDIGFLSAEVGQKKRVSINKIFCKVL